jgi:hypothetical protein
LLLLRRRRRGCARLDEAEYVVLRDTTAHPRAFELRDVYVVFARDVADERAGLRATQIFDGLRAAVCARRGVNRLCLAVAASRASGGRERLPFGLRARTLVVVASARHFGGRRRL